MGKYDLPLVSVVAVCYNHSAFVSKTLESIINQSYENIQLIIIDDCSEDDSVQQIESWIDKRNIECQFIANKENLGVCKSLNIALDYVKGEFFQGISCDDTMMPGKLTRQVDLLSRRAEVTMVYGAAQIIDENDQVIESKKVLDNEAKPGLQDNPNLMKKMMSSSKIIAPTILLRMKDLPASPVYDESLLFEDLYLFLKLLDQGKRFYFLDEVLVNYRFLETSLYRSKELKSRYMADRNQLIKGYIGRSIELNLSIYKSLNRGMSLSEAFNNYLKRSIGTMQFALKLRSTFAKVLYGVRKQID